MAEDVPLLFCYFYLSGRLSHVCIAFFSLSHSGSKELKELEE
jgi:hypothetical protein